VLTRRAFLMGGGAVVALGGAGVYELSTHPYRRAQIEDALGLTSGPEYVPPPSDAVQSSGTFASRAMGRAVAWTVSVPAHGVAPGAVIFCLHAKGGDHRMAFDDIRVPDMAAAIGLHVAVAGVDGGADSYWHRRADGTDALAMVLNEFVPMVRARLGVMPQALMGWSMGGYGSLLVAERAAGQFRAVAPAGPALWRQPGETAPGAFDSASDYQANDVFAGVEKLRDAHVAIACGLSDPFYPAARSLAERMDFPHDEFFKPGQHNGGFWRSVARRQLRAIAPALGLRASS
jgi:pimeloyl-ACP methyl ester carboxylesterase